MNLFGTDGIRGIANSELSPHTAFALGRAVGWHLSPPLPICVGRDTRLSGFMLEAALVAGLASTGRNVVQAGVVTTPGLSFLVKDLGLAGGVMISASHNPAIYNGLKVLDQRGTKISEDTEMLLSEAMSNPEGGPRPFGDAVGTVLSFGDLVGRYVQFLRGIPSCNFAGLKVVVDAAHGSASPVAESVWKALGADVRVMNACPDGLNINKDCGSTCPGALADRVKATGAHVGFAYDGDGDRCIAVDEHGQVVDGDGLMAALARDMARRGVLKGNAVVGTVMSNLGLELALREQGISLLRTPVGDRYVLEKMRETGCNLGGEQSGHIICGDVLQTGDGLITSLLVADALLSNDAPLSALGAVKTIPQRLVNVSVTHPDRVASDPKVLEAVKKVETHLGDEGRVLVRASGTEPVVRIMVEAFSLDRVERSVSYLKDAILGAVTP